MKNKIKANQLSYRNLIHNLSFEVNEGEILLVAGAKHSGKSTLLSILSGLIVPSDGTVTVNNRLINQSPCNIGYVYDYNHFCNTDSMITSPVPGKYTHNYIIINHELSVYSYIAHSPTNTNNIDFLIKSLLCFPEIILIDEPFLDMSDEYISYYSESLKHIVESKNKICIVSSSPNNKYINHFNRIIYLN